MSRGRRQRPSRGKHLAGGGKPQGDGNGGGKPQDGEGGGQGGAAPFPISSSPHAASMLGQVGVTDVAVSQADKDAGKFQHQGNFDSGGVGEVFHTKQISPGVRNTHAPRL